MRNTITTPKGIARYPRLNTPDCRFKADGEYSVILRLPDAQAKPLVEQLAKSFEEGYKAEVAKAGGRKVKKAAGLPWGPAADWDKDSESEVAVPGFTDFKFKLPAKGVSAKTGKAWERRPALFDAKLQPLPADSDPIGGGSVIRVNCEPYVWNTASLGCGISLRIQAVQVIELKTYGGNPAAGFVEEDGYTAKVTSEVGGFTADESSGDF